MPSKARTICNRDGLGKALELDNLGPLLPGLFLTKDDTETTLRGFLEPSTSVKKSDKDQYCIL